MHLYNIKSEVMRVLEYPHTCDIICGAHKPSQDILQAHILVEISTFLIFIYFFNNN